MPIFTTDYDDNDDDTEDNDNDDVDDSNGDDGEYGEDGDDDNGKGEECALSKVSLAVDNLQLVGHFDANFYH